MKNLILITLSLICNYASKSQCRIQTNEREDGSTIQYISPDRIGRADKFYMAVSMQTNGNEFYVVTLSVFPTKAQDLAGKMTIKFANNKSSELEHISSHETTINGYPATISIYNADNNDLKVISSSNLKYIMVQLDNGIFQTVIVKLNYDILKRQYNCLKN